MKLNKLVLLFSLIFTSLTTWSQTMNDSLQILYLFENNFADSSGNNRNITPYNGPSFTTNRFGDSNSAVKFDGINDVLKLSNVNAITGNNFSISTWIRLDAWPSSGGNSMFACFGSSTYDHGLTAANNYLGYSGFTSFSYNAGSANAAAYDPNYSVSLSTWYHLTMVRSGYTLKFYINGILVDSDIVNSNPSFTSSNSLWLGARIGNSMFANGALDEFRIYNRSLSNSEVYQLYSENNNNPPAPPYVPSPVCLEYEFQNNTLDSGGQAYNLTNHGATFTNDRFGNPNSAILLDGVNDYLDLNNADSLATGEVTVAAWIKVLSSPASNQQGGIIVMGDNTFDHGINYANNYLGTYSGFTAYSYTTANSNASAYDSAGAININLNDWYHVAMTRNDSVHKLFINGTLVDYQLVNAEAGFNNSGNKIWIGARYGNSSFFNGVVDEIHICNRALTDQDIADLYVPFINNPPAPPYVPSPVCLEYEFQNNTLDSGGQAYNLTNHGATFTNDRFGNPNSALLLDGVNDYLDLNNADSLATGEVTVAAWIKVLSSPASNQQGGIIVIGDNTFDHGINYANNYLGTYSGFTAYSYTTANLNASAYDSAGMVNLILNDWYHVAMTRNDSVHKFFINGTLVDYQLVNSEAGFNTSGNKMWIGARYGNSSFFNGVVDEVHICNRALTDQDITDLYVPFNNNPPAPYVPSPVCLEYQFQNNTLDSGGQAYNLTNHGGTFTNDRFGNANSAILLDGVNDYLDLNNADSLTTGEITIAAWVKVVSSPANNQQGGIIVIGDNTYDHGINYANNYLGTYSGFTAYSYTTPNSNASAYDSAGSVNINLNDWYHVAMTRNDSVHKFFINGTLVDYQLVNSEAGFNTSGNKIWIGARYGNSSFFNGAVDEVHICNRALTDQDIADLYVPFINNPPAPPYVPSPVCLAYLFENNTLDSGGQGYNLTNFGASFTNDRFGNPNSAILLDGVDDFLELSNADSLASGEMTVAAWIKIISKPTSGNQSGIIVLGDSIFDHGINYANNYLNLYSGYTSYSYNPNSTNASAYDSVGSMNINLNSWHHVAMTRNDSVLTFYIDGNLIDYELLNTKAGFNLNGNKLWFGARYGNSSFFNGAIDDVFICNRAMDSASVVAYYQQLTTSIQKIENKNSWALYPNPSNGKFHIESAKNIAKLTIYSIQGQLLFEDTQRKTYFDGQLISGTYIIEIETEKGIRMTKHLIVR